MCSTQHKFAAKLQYFFDICKLFRIFLHVIFIFCHCKYTGDGKPVDNVSASVFPAYLRKKATSLGSKVADYYTNKFVLEIIVRTY